MIPPRLPLVPVLCIEAGHYLLFGASLTEFSFRTIGEQIMERFWEWLLGACVVGPALAIGVGAAIWLLAALLQRRPPPDGAATAPP